MRGMRVLFSVATVVVVPAVASVRLESAEPKATAPRGASAELKLPPPVTQVGDKRTREESSEIRCVIEMGGRKFKLEKSERAKESTEVLAVKGNGPSRLKVTYIELQSEQTLGGKATKKPQPLAGKSYIASLEGDEIKFTTADGQAVTPEERDALAKKVDKLGRPPVMPQIIAARPWKIGEKYALSAEELKRLKAAGRGEGKPVAEEMSLTLRSFDDKMALFDVETVLRVERDASDSLRFNLKGPLKLDVMRVAATEMTLSGTLGGKGAGTATSGTMDLKLVWTY